LNLQSKKRWTHSSMIWQGHNIQDNHL
jgi:hypothetical protein